MGGTLEWGGGFDMCHILTLLLIRHIPWKPENAVPITFFYQMNLFHKQVSYGSSAASPTQSLLLRLMLPFELKCTDKHPYTPFNWKR